MIRQAETTGPDGLTAAERCRTIEAEPLPASLNDLLDRASAEAPDATIWNFVDDGVTHTYAEARRMVMQMATALHNWGVRKGDAVAVMLPNSVDYPVLWLALARLGAAIVPVNIRYEQREVAFVIRKSKACRFVVHDNCAKVLTGETQALLPKNGVAVAGGKPSSADFKSLDDIYDTGRGKHPPAVHVTADDLVNIQFTSGTTGFPKGCELTHRYWLISGKVNAARDGRVYRKIWASTPFTYMDPHWLLLMAIYRCGTLFVAQQQSASRFMGWIREYGIEFCILPALTLKQPPNPHDADNALIRANVYGVTPYNRQQIEKRFNVTAREAFGMTEIGSGLFLPIEATDKADAGSCGRPAPFRRARIVDKDGLEVGTGEVGELQISGQGILRGYFGDPEATREAFDDEWFRTGDLFWRDEDGFYYIVGRIKDSIRRSGENISAREVEAVVRELDCVYEVAAIPVPSGDRGEELKICVVPVTGASDRDVMADKIIDHTSRNLAVFKRPRFISIIDEFPLTPSGKVAKQMLKDADWISNIPSYDCETGTWSDAERASFHDTVAGDKAGRVT
ncbi:class I adenylate-forming enzyme family protein [Hoeflea sp. CAU 1731]